MEIIPVGGYKEVGRNCIVVKSGDEAVMLDLGLHLDNYIRYTESDDVLDMSARKLMEINAVPNITDIKPIKKCIKAICLSHAHLDHLGAVPYLANKFFCPVHATPYTIEVLRTIMQDEGLHIDNELVTHKTNSRFRVSENIEVEFINVTHSTPHTVIIAVHTREGTVVYANDFKFDSNPVLGKKPDFKRIQALDAKVLIMDSLYALNYRKTPSEAIARDMLKDVLLATDTEGKNIVITTFSSHIARLNSIFWLGKKLNRKVVFLGRSLAKYLGAAEACGLVDFNSKVDIIKYGKQIRRYLKNLKRPERHLFVATGGQGEPKATLWKMATGAFPFHEGDEVIFSCNIIPVLENIANRERLESQLSEKKVRIFRDIHVSGHASREDHRDMIGLLKPEHIIPTHAAIDKLEGLKQLALEMHYTPDKVHILGNGEHLRLH